MSEYEVAVMEFKRNWIKRVLQRHKGNRVSASAELGMHRNTLIRHLEALNLLEECPVTRGNPQAYKNSETYNRREVNLCAS